MNFNFYPQGHTSCNKTAPFKLSQVCIHLSTRHSNTWAYYRRKFSFKSSQLSVSLLSTIVTMRKIIISWLYRSYNVPVADVKSHLISNISELILSGTIYHYIHGLYLASPLGIVQWPVTGRIFPHSALQNVSKKLMYLTISFHWLSNY